MIILGVAAVFLANTSTIDDCVTIQSVDDPPRYLGVLLSLPKTCFLLEPLLLQPTMSSLLSDVRLPLLSC